MEASRDLGGRPAIPVHSLTLMATGRGQSPEENPLGGVVEDRGLLLIAEEIKPLAHQPDRGGILMPGADLLGTIARP